LLTHLRVRTRYLLKTEGLGGLPGAARRLARSLMRSVFCCERYVVYRFDTDVRTDGRRAPNVEGLEVLVLERSDDVERFASLGYDLPAFHPAFRSEWLERGGIAFCALVQRQMAHIAWVALSAGARGCCDALPYHVDFAGGEACWGGSYTWPRFRGLGIYTHVCGLRLRYMHEHGFNRCRDAVRVNNAASLRGQRWWGPMPCLSGRFIRLLNWTRWREEPYEGTSS